MVYLAGGKVGVCPHGDGDHILPVALMAQIDKERFAVATQLLYELGVGEAQATAHLLVGDVHQLHRFQHVVAEVAVEFLLNLPNLLLGLLGEGVHKVVVHHLASIAHHIIHDRIYEATQHIEHPIRPNGYRL